ncbi:hypothetical protein VY88_20240 [Azospirillum thiophilum]|uniref:HTH gntR-type domain-containing protein n=1 Tax=Azospirillum thiophilum TaxID=528244 RepID=A0AAC8ZVQ8_9PROT|nr:GntR family transcriptional regulator [Azospirillum thiophilum]ALG74348.1 hypothetical protein AL072_25730 [Azospirillum thiophilum]KJR63784.1 hypothetical protein VY88_20240 [Azospirillum thiophilum]
MSTAENSPAVRPPRPRSKRGDAGSADDVLDQLRRRISSHVLPPGSRIQETELAREFDISRARVREVLGALEQRGLIERIPNRGAVVMRLEPKEVFEIFDVREVLEGLCIRRATINAPDGAWDGLLETFGEPMRAAIEEGGIEQYLDGLDELRRVVIQWADNTHAANFLDVIFDKARVIAQRVTLLPGRAEAGRRMHQEMLQCMARRDADAAERLKREIIRSAREWLERYRHFVL